MVRILICFFLLVAQQAFSQVTVYKLAQMDAYLERISHYGFSGAFGIEDKNVHFTKAYGFDRRLTGVPFQSDMAVNVASISKTFMAYAILKLHGEKKLALSDSLHKWFTSIPANKVAITISDLLSNSSGLDPDFFTVPGVDKDSLLRGIFTLPVKQKGKWSYSNAGFSLLAMIIEKASGTAYREYMKREVFVPLGLYSTGFLSEKYMPANKFAHSYNRDLEFPITPEWPGLIEQVGAADIVSNIPDLLRWAHLNADSNLINKTTFSLQYMARIPITALTSYGYGWFIEKQKDGSVSYRHGGNSSPFGITSELRIYPAHAANYILLCTQMNEEIPFIRLPRTELTKIIVDSSYIPALMKYDLDYNAKPDSVTYGKNNSVIKIYHENGLNYIEMQGQYALNTLLDPKEADAKKLTDLTGKSLLILKKLSDSIYSPEDPIAQKDWYSFEKLNGKVSGWEALGTIPNGEDQFTTFIRCFFKNKTVVVRFFWDKNRMRYIAQNEKYGPRWNMVNIAQTNRWLGYDLANDRSFILEFQKDVVINNSIF